MNVSMLSADAALALLAYLFENALWLPRILIKHFLLSILLNYYVVVIKHTTAYI